MDLLVMLSLALYILFDGFLIPVSADGVHVEPTGPEMASPEYFLEFGMQAEHFFRREMFRCFDDLCGCHHGHGLDEKVYMVLICSNLDVVQFIMLFNFIADIFEGLFVLFHKDLPPVFGRTDQVVEEESDVVAFVNVLAVGHGTSLPHFTCSIAL